MATTKARNHAIIKAARDAGMQCEDIGHDIWKIRSDKPWLCAGVYDSELACARAYCSEHAIDVEEHKPLAAQITSQVTEILTLAGKVEELEARYHELAA